MLTYSQEEFPGPGVRENPGEMSATVVAFSSFRVIAALRRADRAETNGSFVGNYASNGYRDGYGEILIVRILKFLSIVVQWVH